MDNKEGEQDLDLDYCTKAECLAKIEKAFEGAPDDAKVDSCEDPYCSGTYSHFIQWLVPLSTEEVVMADNKEAANRAAEKARLTKRLAELS